MSLAQLLTPATEPSPSLNRNQAPTLSRLTSSTESQTKARRDLETSVTVRNMTRSELDTTLKWAEKEGWNPGLNDASVFWATDPDGFLVAEVDGEMVGTGSVIRYQPNSFFLGLFMIRQDLRGSGLGRQVFQNWRLTVQRSLRGSTAEAPVVAMDGVVAMQPFYSAAGFQLAHQQTRYRCTAGVWAQVATASEGTIKDLVDVPFDLVEKFDRQHFGAGRTNFLRRWVAPESGAGRVLIGSDGEIKAMGVIRRAYRGWRVGPLFATESEAASRLFRDLCYSGGVAPGEDVYIDIPEVNEAGLALAQQYTMQADFTCGRMYFNGVRPSVPWRQVFGVTTIELG